MKNLSSTTAKGTEYELLVQQVFKMLHTAEGVEQINIQHNVILIGISGAKHQIDLYWEFKIAGVIYRVAVECKNYASPVSKDKITSFKGVLDDLGIMSGIYVCASGYQKGAKQIAEAYGIQLLEVRRPTDEDWNGRMRDIHLQMHFMSRCNFKVGFVVDKKWAEQNHIEKTNGIHALTNETIIEIAAAEAGSIFNELDKPSMDAHYIRKTLHDFIRKLPADTAGQGIEKVYAFNDAFLSYEGSYSLECDNSKRQFALAQDASIAQNVDPIDSKVRFKIKGLKIVYDVNEYVDNINIYGDNIVMAIVKNIKEQSEKTVAWDGRVWNRE